MQTIQDLLQVTNIGRWGLIGLIVAITFAAGFMLDPLVIILIVVPITAPLVAAAGFDVVWYCVLFLVILQTAYLTPPMAPSIFYLRGIAPKEITLRDMYRGVWPFIGVQLVVILLIVIFPELVLWLPAKMQS
jgi:TRAP-type mannitol/chloroaromatic compound transport system permease large subunit